MYALKMVVIIIIIIMAPPIATNIADNNLKLFVH